MRRKRILNRVRMSFNRTFMELKSLLQELKEQKQRSFNRTFMELKCIQQARPIQSRLF